MFKLIVDLIFRFNKDDVPALSSQLAFNLVLSFFPFLIFLMTLIGHISLNGMELLLTFSKILPASVFNLVKNTILEVVNTKNSQLMSFSLLITLWSASSGFSAVIKGLNKAYGVKESRSFVRVRFVSVLCTLGVTFLIILMGLLLVFGRIIWNSAASRFSFSYELSVLWMVIRYIIVVSTAIGTFMLLYQVAPNRRLAWIDVVPGSLFSTAGLMFVSTIFAYYVNNFANYSIVYGSLGAIVVLLTWLFLVSVIVIMGGEVNASLALENNSSVPGKRKI